MVQRTPYPFLLQEAEGRITFRVSDNRWAIHQAVCKIVARLEDLQLSKCAPRVSGDEPEMAQFLISLDECSPRERG